MVRTNRSSGTTAAPASMDDIDLDVMFAADGDALFDGLDIDLDMDDITGGAGGGSSSSGALDASHKLNPSSTNRRMVSRPPPQALPTSPDNQNGEDELSRTRRKTKRKAKTPSFFEDDDDDYDEGPASKKKRKASSTSKAIAANTTALTKKKATTKIAQEDMSMNLVKPSPTIPKAKSKSTKSSTGMPPPLARTGPWVPASSSSNGAQHVAASGQFGNRQKQRTSGMSFPSLPKGGGASVAGVASSNPGGRMMNKLPLARSVSEASVRSKTSTQQQQQQQKRVLPQESTYCGLQPSPTQFYPFMPALPTEPVLKSRKIYGSIDRIHTSLVGYLHTAPTASSGVVQAKENEPLFHLLQEAFKEEKSSAAALRLESIGVSIGELRQTINSMDKNRIISDWYGVCALIKRQHDFLKQNCENMERWCRDNFSKEDFAEVFVPSKKRKETDGSTTLSILKSFTKREIKVKISFTGLKDPKIPAYVLAVFPPLFLPNEVTTVEETETKQTSNTKKKAHTTSGSILLQDGRTTELISPSSKIKPPQPLSYANMKPPRRRRNVAEMIARTARELSKAHSLRVETARKAIDRREGELQKVLSQDGTCGMNTTAMWKWLEVSEFFNDYTLEDVEDCLQDIRTTTIPNGDDTSGAINDDRIQSFLISGEGVVDNVDDATLFDRLQSLLVDVHSCDKDDENDSCTEMGELDNESIDEICDVTDFIDLSSFTLEERSCIVLRSCGFTDVHAAEQIAAPMGHSDSASGDGCNGYDHSLTQNGKISSIASVDKKKDLDDVIAAMKSELDQVEEINDARVTYLESVSNRYRRLRKDRLQQSEKDVGLISKYQQLMRKSKDLKAKSGTTIRKDDSLALPW